MEPTSTEPCGVLHLQARRGLSFLCKHTCRGLIKKSNDGGDVGR